MSKINVLFLCTANSSRSLMAEAENRYPKAFPEVANRLLWPFDDPAAEPGSEEVRLQKFREVRDQIDERIKEWLSDKNI